jgi:hypothetical protein
MKTVIILKKDKMKKIQVYNIFVRLSLYGKMKFRGFAATSYSAKGKVSFGKLVKFKTSGENTIFYNQCCNP